MQRSSPIPPVLTGHVIAAVPVQTNLSPFVTLKDKKKGSLSTGANARQRGQSKKTWRTLPAACPIQWVPVFSGPPRNATRMPWLPPSSQTMKSCNKPLKASPLPQAVVTFLILAFLQLSWLPSFHKTMENVLSSKKISRREAKPPGHGYLNMLSALQP